MVTPGIKIRLARSQWEALMARAGTQGTDGSGVIKILVAKYLDGSLDTLVASALAAESEASTAGGQQTEQAVPPGVVTG